MGIFDNVADGGTGGGGDGCNCAGNSGMYGNIDLDCGEDGTKERHRLAGQIIVIPLSSPCLFCTLIQAIT